jgi:hypothetical protein
MLNEELDNFARMQVSRNLEVALGLRKNFDVIQKSTLGPWSKSRQKTVTLSQRKRSRQEKLTMGPRSRPIKPESTLFCCFPKLFRYFISQSTHSLHSNRLHQFKFELRVCSQLLSLKVMCGSSLSCLAGAQMLQ